MRSPTLACLIVATAAAGFDHGGPPAPATKRAVLITETVARLVSMQAADGSWPYDVDVGVDGEVPLSFNVASTAIVAQSLLCAGNRTDKQVNIAVDRASAFILQSLNHPQLADSTQEVFDVRIWGQAYALEFLCRLNAAGFTTQSPSKLRQAIRRLVPILLAEELPGGGWNYATRRQPASFMTAIVTQALLLARSQGQAIPDIVFERSRAALKAARTNAGGFLYGGHVLTQLRDGHRSELPGAIARTPLCETTLMLLGAGSVDAVRESINAFHDHWNELVARCKMPGDHAPPFSIAPYYFYFGHRYAAQAIEMLPPAERFSARRRMSELVLRTRDADGTWNDRAFLKARSVCTAMCVIALLGDGFPVSPPFVPAPASVPASLRSK